MSDQPALRLIWRPDGNNGAITWHKGTNLRAIRYRDHQLDKTRYRAAAGHKQLGAFETRLEAQQACESWALDQLGLPFK